MSRPDSMRQAREWANAPETYWYIGSGIELAITLDDARSCSHSGPCDDDVRALSMVGYITEQLEGINEETLREVLREYGAWDDEQLADHAQNLQRLLWGACNDIVEEYGQ